MKAAQTLTHRGNQAFLANPVPHTLNLTNLAYNKYGLPTTVRGLANAARVSTGTVGKGKLAGDISELEQMGAKSQYRNIFDELGLTRLPGIPGLNRGGIPGTEGIANVLNKTAIIPLERASNYAQHKILNPVETGLRAAALNAERKGGTTGVEAARHIHQTFGTGRANKIVRDVAEFGTPFAQFHFQTAPASGLRTLATHPARVLNAVKSEQDMNRQINPGQSPQYRSSVPSLSTVRAMVDPLSYFANLGGLSELNSPFGTLEQLKKGNVAGVLGNAAGRFTPGSPELSAAYAMATKKKGRSGEKALNDLISALVGGYYVKK
jgi:hypothetical protein